jgi:hypothetical protein
MTNLTKTEAFIIRNNKLIATCKTSLKNGAIIAYSYNKREESIHADREFNLVSQKFAKISRAKKWRNNREDYFNSDYAEEINESEFYLY